MIDELPTSDAPHPLPEPQSERFRPLRAGILSVWQYDEQEFWFHGGRLVLRGGNEAGKSKAMELLLPFLFDANIQPSRLDPFGGTAKTMHWNLIGFDPNRKTATGYTWIEFGRRDGSGQVEFRTLIAGMRAKRDRRDVRTWYAITGQRVGADLELAPGRIPLSREKLSAALTDPWRVFDTASEYRANVNAALFGLESERYDALVHLLLRLRRPQLSAKLEPVALSGVLSQSLSPLDPGRVEPVSRSFDQLEQDAEQLAGLERTLGALKRFKGVYAVYAKQHASVVGAQFRSAVTAVDNVTRTVRLAEEQLTEIRNESARHVDREARLEERRAKNEAQIRVLEGSDAFRDSRRLDDLRQVASLAGGRERERADELNRTKSDVRGASEDRTAAAARRDDVSWE